MSTTISKTLANLFAAYGERDTKRVDVYFKIFRKFKPELFADACGRLLLSSRFLPTVSEILAEYDRAQRPQLETPDDAAHREALDVLRLMRLAGANNPPEFRDPITKKLFESRFNWRSLCETLREDASQWFVREFVKLYAVESRLHRFPQIDTTKINAVFDSAGINPLKRIE